MVRLKVLYGGGERGVGIVFQFHYGTIKSIKFTFEYLSPILFQFHYGTIKSKDGALLFQFPYYISIPLWYD